MKKYIFKRTRDCLYTLLSYPAVFIDFISNKLSSAAEHQARRFCLAWIHLAIANSLLIYFVFFNRLFTRHLIRPGRSSFTNPRWKRLRLKSVSQQSLHVAAAAVGAESQQNVGLKMDAHTKLYTQKQIANKLDKDTLIIKWVFCNAFNEKHSIQGFK